MGPGKFYISAVLFLIVAGILFVSETFAEKKNQRGSDLKGKEPVYLYYADKNSRFLEAEEIYLSHSKDPVSFGKLIIKTLAEGSIQNRVGTLPENITLRALFVDRDGTCFVDFADSIKEVVKLGCYDEILAVYSIVNSLVTNIPEIKRVKILIGGQESETFCGHLDLSQPFKANMYLVR